jgi:4-hydroxy-3-polyprenylbenzoate decarboxylase
MKIILGITGASGAIYAQRLIKYFDENRDKFLDIEIIFTKMGQKVWQFELEKQPIAQIPFKIYDNEDLFAAPASGSANYDAMVVCPCSMGTLGKIANGITDNLLTRSADVILKENKKLILVPREMPLNAIHINNMYNLKIAGAEICPAMPSFYSKPKNIEELVDTVIQKIFALLQINIQFFKWK